MTQQHDVDRAVGRVRAPSVPSAELGLRAESTGASFRLRRERAHTRPVYFRAGYGRLEFGDDLAAFLAPGARLEPEPGALLALMHGQAAPADHSPLPGVRRLTLDTEIRVDADGVTVTQTPPELPVARRLEDAVRDALARNGDHYAIGYSGGVSSAYLAVVAAGAGHRARVVHADLGLPGQRPPAAVPLLDPRPVRVDPCALVDHHTVTGAELLPPLPEFVAPRRLHAALSGESALPVVSGALLASLVSVKLPDVPRGPRSWRLLTCEPFHISGALDTLADAVELLDNRVVYTPGRRPGSTGEPDAQQIGAPPPPSPTGGSGLGWLTEEGRQAYETAHRGSMAVWQDRLDALQPVVGTLMGGLEERGADGASLPAADPEVLAAAHALPPRARGRIRRGALQNHLPLHRVLAAAGVDGLSRASHGHWLRLCAAGYLHRERRKITAELGRECALGDLGLVDPAAVLADLQDGAALSAKALPLLRLVWLDRWLRERS
ncbi:hypothetical protein ABT300_27720 [Streptomyces sp. NPDC001027]|uniref:hypothetical protein n=1 Tax=Streptomyces sp. NPDC001027 TaxID=3154771 RepID=UPI00331F202B